jgi:hypothetical protein
MEAQFKGDSLVDHTQLNASRGYIEVREYKKASVSLQD